MKNNLTRQDFESIRQKAELEQTSKWRSHKKVNPRNMTAMKNIVH